MEEIAISKFKATCLAVLENVRKTGKTVLVTRFGEPVAEVVPPRKPRKTRRWLGSRAGNWPNRRRHRFSSQRRRRLGRAAGMKLLLDTHIWLWSALNPARLSSRVAAALENPSNELWLSPISLWEVLTLCQKRRLILDPNPQAWIADTLDTTPMREAQVTYQVAQETGRVQLPHRDRPTVFWWPRRGLRF